MFRSIKTVISGVLLSFCVITSVQAKELRVNLVATIDNGPAMENVSWKLFRVDTPNGKDNPVTADNHSTHVLLPEGRYRAVATLTTSNNKTITKVMDFHVRTTDSRVVIPMDK